MDYLKLQIALGNLKRTEELSLKFTDIILLQVLEENEMSCMDLLHINTDGLILTKRSKKLKLVI